MDMKSVLGLSLAFGVFASLVVRAELPDAVGLREIATAGTNNQTLTVTGTHLIEGAVRKTGTGAWTVPAATIFSGSRAAWDVLAGSVALTGIGAGNAERRLLRPELKLLEARSGQEDVRSHLRGERQLHEARPPLHLERAGKVNPPVLEREEHVAARALGDDQRPHRAADLQKPAVGDHLEAARRGDDGLRLTCQPDIRRREQRALLRVAPRPDLDARWPERIGVELDQALARLELH